MRSLFFRLRHKVLMLCAGVIVMQMGGCSLAPATDVGTLFTSLLTGGIVVLGNFLALRSLA